MEKNKSNTYFLSSYSVRSYCVVQLLLYSVKMSQSTIPNSAGGRADKVLGLLHRWNKKPGLRKEAGKGNCSSSLNYHVMEEEKGKSKDKSCQYQISISFFLLVSHLQLPLPRFGALPPTRGKTLGFLFRLIPCISRFRCIFCFFKNLILCNKYFPI